jgi:putative membrane protein
MMGSVEAGFQTRDATRRTRLANERTFLAWWRSGLTALAVSLAAGKLLPEVAGGTAWPYEVVGAGYAVLGIAFIAYGQVRQVHIERAIAADDYAPLDPRLALALTAFGVALAAATVVLLVVD